MTERALIYLLPSDVSTSVAGALSLSWPTGEQPFGHRRAMHENDALQTIRLQPDALNPEECAAVIALGEARPRMPGRVEVGESTYRASHIAWIEPQDATAWLFHRVGMLFALANRHFGFELCGLLDAIQYTSYGPGEHFDWHMDLGPGQTSARKLSLTIQLSESGAYSGGDLEFINAGSGPEARMQGAATFFPSYLAHRVTPIASGLRRSLVAWACGDAFR
jgi:PKHD-type hydroxylase